MMARPLTIVDPRALPERFWEKVEKTNGCWLWTGCLTGAGYGQFRVGGRKGKAMLTHRLAFEERHGPIPEGLTLDHLCRTPSCLNPDHLEAVTQRVNLLRGETITARNAAVTHCPSGHAYDAENTYVCPRGTRRCRACAREKRIAA